MKGFLAPNSIMFAMILSPYKWSFFASLSETTKRWSILWNNALATENDYEQQK